MIRVGFITEHPTKPKSRFFGEYTEESFLNSKNPFELIQIMLPVSADRLERMSEKRRLKVLDKAKGIMHEKGVEKIFFSPEIKRISNISTDEELHLNKKRIFDKWVYRCVLECAKKCGICLLDSKICIRDSKLERISGNLLRRFCYDTKNLWLCTLDFSRAKVLCEELFEDAGMMVRMVGVDYIKSADVLIDVDNALVRVGRNLVIDGVSGDYELDGFLIDPVEIAASVIGIGVDNENLSYFFGKKKLTL